MTLKELTHLYELREEQRRLTELLESLREKAQPKPSRITGVPHTSGFSDRVGDLAAEIADTEESIKELEMEIDTEEIKAAKFIGNIRDVQVRMIFRLRFLRGLSWKEVSGVMGRNYTPNSVKLRCYKYLCEHPDGTEGTRNETT